jgi:hypothetical protein
MLLWHRLHLYGDVYSSPGLELRQKQLLMVAFLGQADMHDELFGHALAVRTSALEPIYCCATEVQTLVPC